MEASNDIPLKQRLFWLQMYKAKVTNSKNMVHIQATARRLKNQGKQAKHLIFPDITSLVSQVFSTNPSNAESLLDSLLLQLRLSTLMRSVDMSQVMWGLLRHDNSFYIKTTDKNAKVQLFNVTDPTLHLLLKYLVNHVQHPGLFLFRHLKQPHLYLSAERLAKRVQKFMQAAGINVQVFKSHSLRGATATHLLRQGCDKSWVKTRGGWSSMATLDLYYDRLHQTQDWAQLVQGMPVTPAPAMGEHDLGEYRQTASNAAESAKSAYPEATKEAGGEADEQEKAALLAVLTAHGILRLLHGSQICPSCGGPLQMEASFSCASCSSVFHVRCLHRQNDDIPSKLCFVCAMKSAAVSETPSATEDPPALPSVQQKPQKTRAKDIIVDVMGVCAQE